MATWQHTLGPRARDAIAVYYARYPDATPGEIQAWLRDRGFDAGRSDIEDYMAALDTNPNWRTGWINRNIHRYSPALDPDEFLATRGYGEDDGWQVSAEELQEVDATAGEEHQYAEWDGDGGDEQYAYNTEFISPYAPAPPKPLASEDRLPGIVVAVLGLAASAGIALLIIAALR